mmetsp:Transcript_3524/g.8029  ORF Transcript_3524/g.8029 Transcript_3524/m.8029 type:complete len:230 (-) Transcript_3524:432-1121(-)
MRCDAIHAPVDRSVSKPAFRVVVATGRSFFSFPGYHHEGHGLPPIAPRRDATPPVAGRSTPPCWFLFSAANNTVVFLLLVVFVVVAVAVAVAFVVVVWQVSIHDRTRQQVIQERPFLPHRCRCALPAQQSLAWSLFAVSRVQVRQRDVDKPVVVVVVVLFVVGFHHLAQRDLPGRPPAHVLVGFQREDELHPPAVPAAPGVGPDPLRVPLGPALVFGVRIGKPVFRSGR